MSFVIDCATSLIQYNYLDTGAKPFQCTNCQRCFSRQDSLARHEKLHTRRRQPTEAHSNQGPEYSPGTPESIRRTGSIHDAISGTPTPSFVDSRSLEDTSLPTAIPPAAHQGTELDFDLIWPDSEDLFQTIISTDTAYQFQMPPGALPFSVSASPSSSDLALATPSSFDERPSSIGAIPSGGNSQAVQDVSKMISNLVRAINQNWAPS